MFESRALPGLALLLLGSSCSLLVDDAPYACGESGSCVQPNELPCIPHKLCADPQQLCVADGAKTSCRPLLAAADSCSHTYPLDPAELGDADIFPIGVIAQWQSAGSDSNYGVPTTQAIEVAVEAINKTGLPVRDNPTRKLLAIVCNEAPGADDSLSGDRPFLKPRVEHLVRTLRVPAIIGGSTSGATIPINGTHLSGYDTLLLSPTATSDSIPDAFRADEDGEARQLFWRTVAPDGQQRPVIVAAHDLVKNAISAGSTEPDKLAAISVYDVENDASTNLQDLFVELRGFLSGQQSYISRDAAAKAAAVQKIVDAEPRFILPFGTDEFVNSMLADIEAKWTEKDRAWRPWYIMTEGNRSGDFRSTIEAQPSIVDRVIGTAPGARRSTLYDVFKTAFEAYFQGRPYVLEGSSPTPGNLAESGYDAAFLLAYAATQASRDGAWPRGPELATALDSFHCDGATQHLRAHRGQYYVDVAALARDLDGCFEFDGASGPLDFSASELSMLSSKAKDPSADFALWCVRDVAEADTTTNLEQYYAQEKSAIVAEKGIDPLSVVDAGWCERFKRR
jgi:hypothetical protein